MISPDVICQLTGSLSLTLDRGKDHGWFYRNFHRPIYFAYYRRGHKPTFRRTKWF